jgi:hypothetical protein
MDERVSNRGGIASRPVRLLTKDFRDALQANAARLHHIPKQRYRVTNWSEYNAALRQRGSLTVWFSDEALAAWRAEPRTTRGGQAHYSALAIRTALTLRAVFRLALHQTEGLIRSILQLLSLDLVVPDHSTLSRRAETLEVPKPCPSSRGPVHLVVDSTDVRRCSPGEWLIEKRGTRKRRSWRKLHIGVDAWTGQILVPELTSSDVEDGSQVEPLFDQITAPLASFIGDEDYDQAGIYDTIAKRHPEADVIVPPRSTAVLSDMADCAPTQRDRHLQSIVEHGRRSWQKRLSRNQREHGHSTGLEEWPPLIATAIRQARKQVGERQNLTKRQLEDRTDHSK